MFSTLEVAAKGLLADPSWNWVFKNTFDAMEEQLNKVYTLCIIHTNVQKCKLLTIWGIDLDSSRDGFCGYCREIFVQLGIRLIFQVFCDKIFLHFFVSRRPVVHC